MAERERSPRGAGHRLRGEVLAAVDRLLGEPDGYDRLTMRSVAKEAGVSAPSIYLQFADKYELVWAVLSEKYAVLAADMRAAAESAESADARVRLRAEAHAYCRFALVNPGHYRLMYEVRQPSAEGDQVLRHPSRLVSQRFRDAVGACAQAGHPMGLPVRQTAYTLWTGLHGFVSVHHVMVAAPAEELAPVAFEFTLGLADGLLDALVGPERAPKAPEPPDTTVERRLASGLGVAAERDGL